VNTSSASEAEQRPGRYRALERFLRRLARAAASATRTTSAISLTRLLLSFIGAFPTRAPLFRCYYSRGAGAASGAWSDEQGIHARGDAPRGTEVGPGSRGAEDYITRAVMRVSDRS